jgi:hypothetical protein
MRIRWARLVLGASLAPMVVAAALASCSSDSPANGTAGAGGSGASSGSGSGASGHGSGASGSGGLDFDAGTGGKQVDPDAACASSSAEATLTKKPIDIVMVIDNSGSMGDDIEAVQTNINANFATIIGQSGIDYRVILVADHGDFDPDDSICVAAPLSATTCMPIPAQPAQNPPIFFHYSTEVASHDSLCKLMDSFDATVEDDYGLAPLGWSEWLREEAFKVFVELSDDGVSCGSLYNDGNNVPSGNAMAAQFDADLLALAPEQFGDASKRNYVWHSILGMNANMPASDAWLPADPVQTGTCATGVDPGTGYQALSVLTGGLRFPICEHASYDAVFQAIAEGVIEGAKLECEFPVPDAPPGETIDVDSITVQYTPGGVGAPQTLQQVAGPGFCKADSFYIEAGTIVLCPETCTVVQDDAKAKMLVFFDCESDPT